MPEVISNKKSPKEPEAGRLPETRSYRDGLNKLRKHLIRALSAAMLLAILAFMNRPLIFDQILLAPKTENFITNRILCSIAEKYDIANLCFNAESLTIINVKMAGQFLTHLYVSLIAGIILAFPYILLEIWTCLAFFLKIKSRKTTIATIVSGSFLFAAGLLFSYFLIVPLTVNFLGTYFVSSDVSNNVMLGSYIGTIASLVLGVAVFFELPVFIYFLSGYGIVSPDWLRKRRKMMIVVILILSAIITPPDVISQIMVGIPLMLLYEISIWIAGRRYPKS